MADGASEADDAASEGVWGTTVAEEDESARVDATPTSAQEQPPCTSNAASASTPIGVVVPPPDKQQWMPPRPPSAPQVFAPPRPQAPMGAFTPPAPNTFVPPMQPPAGGAVWTPTCVLRPRAPCPSSWTKLAGGGYAPEVTARDLLNGPLEKIPQQRLEDLRNHLRQYLGAEASKPLPPITAMYVPPDERGDNIEPKADENKETPEQRGTKRSAKAMLISSAWREGACAAAELMAKRKLAKANPGEKLDLYLRQLNYSQDSIKGTFQDGRLVSQMTKELQTGEKRLEDIPTVMALVHNNQVYSVDNRRLWSFKHCGLSPDAKIPVVAARADNTFLRKFTTPTCGKTVRKRS